MKFIECNIDTGKYTLYTLLFTILYSVHYVYCKVNSVMKIWNSCTIDKGKYIYFILFTLYSTTVALIHDTHACIHYKYCLHCSIQYTGCEIHSVYNIDTGKYTLQIIVLTHYTVNSVLLCEIHYKYFS